MTNNARPGSARASTGIAGLDEILQGGLPRNHTYLIQGTFGTGKTTLALQFLLAGAQAGETTLHFSLGETSAELQEVAHGHGWSLAGIQLHELIPLLMTQLEERQTIFPVTEVELDEVTTEILRVLDQVRPQRVVFDFVSQLRLLATTPLRYRQQLLALRQQLIKLGCTALFLSNEILEDRDSTLDSLVHGVITLTRTTPAYGNVRRRLEIAKIRGIRYSGGYHDFEIYTGGLEVYPRIPPGSTRPKAAQISLSCGVAGLDQILGGGLETGTACVIMGQAGTGKSTVTQLYAQAALERGERVAVYLFDEGRDPWLVRAAHLGMAFEDAEALGQLHLFEIDPDLVSPGQFVTSVRQLVEQQAVQVMILDSLTGYLAAMVEGQSLLTQIHQLLVALARRGVLSLIVVTQHGLFDMGRYDGLDMSYLADTVVLLRHFEAAGVVRKAISVVKKRYGAHEHTIRELSINTEGVKIGPPLTAFRGVLTGSPEYTGGAGTDEHDR